MSSYALPMSALVLVGTCPAWASYNIVSDNVIVVVTYLLAIVSTFARVRHESINRGMNSELRIGMSIMSMVFIVCSQLIGIGVGQWFVWSIGIIMYLSVFAIPGDRSDGIQKQLDAALDKVAGTQAQVQQPVPVVLSSKNGGALRQQLDAALERLRKYDEQVQPILVAMETQTSTIRDAIHKATNTVNNIKNPEVEALKATLADLEATWELDQADRIRERRRCIDEFADVNRDMQTRVRALQRLHDEKVKELENIQTVRLASMGVDMQSMEHDDSTASTAREKFITAIKELGGIIENLLQLCTTLGDENRSLQNNPTIFSNIKNDNAALQEMSQEFRSKLEAIDTAHHEEIRPLQEQIQLLITRETEATFLITRIGNTAETLEESINILLEQLEKMGQSHDELKTQLARELRIVSITNANYVQLTARFQALQAEMQALRSGITESLETGKNDIDSHIRDAINQLRSSSARDSQEVKLLQAGMRELEESWDLDSAARTEIQRNLKNQLNTTNTNTTSALGELNARIAVLKQDVGTALQTMRATILAMNVLNANEKASLLDLISALRLQCADYKRVVASVASLQFELHNDNIFRIREHAIPEKLTGEQSTMTNNDNDNRAASYIPYLQVDDVHLHVDGFNTISDFRDNGPSWLEQMYNLTLTADDEDITNLVSQIGSLSETLLNEREEHVNELKNLNDLCDRLNERLRTQDSEILRIRELYNDSQEKYKDAIAKLGKVRTIITSLKGEHTELLTLIQQFIDNQTVDIERFKQLLDTVLSADAEQKRQIESAQSAITDAYNDIRQKYAKDITNRGNATLNEIKQVMSAYSSNKNLRLCLLLLRYRALSSKNEKLKQAFTDFIQSFFITHKKPVPTNIPVHDLIQLAQTMLVASVGTASQLAETITRPVMINKETITNAETPITRERGTQATIPNVQRRSSGTQVEEEAYIKLTRLALLGANLENIKVRIQNNASAEMQTLLLEIRDMENRMAVVVDKKEFNQLQTAYSELDEKFQIILQRVLALGNRITPAQSAEPPAQPAGPSTPYEGANGGEVDSQIINQLLNGNVYSIFNVLNTIEDPVHAYSTTSKCNSFIQALRKLSEEMRIILGTQGQGESSIEKPLLSAAINDSRLRRVKSIIYRPKLMRHKKFIIGDYFDARLILMYSNHIVHMLKLWRNEEEVEFNKDIMFIRTSVDTIRSQTQTTTGLIMQIDGMFEHIGMYDNGSQQKELLKQTRTTLHNASSHMRRESLTDYVSIINRLDNVIQQIPL